MSQYGFWVITDCAITLLLTFSVDFEVLASGQLKQTLERESHKSAVQEWPLAH